MLTDLSILTVADTASVRDAATSIDRNRMGIVLVVDRTGRLVGTVTDGDLRRGLLAQMALDRPLADLLAAKADSPYATPTTGLSGADPQTYLQILREHRLSHLPIVDAAGRLVGLVTRDEYLPKEPLQLEAVIMAGGAGSRLYPLTASTPKPMLKVGDRPIMQILVEQLRDTGVTKVNVATHHNREKITDYFGDGREFGVELSYVTEDRPLGTAGALGLLAPPAQTTLVINGDILTQVDFRAMLEFHRSHQGEMTLAVQPYTVAVPYGVVESDGVLVRAITEKPTLTYMINAGIYLLEPSVYALIPSGERCDMTTLAERLMAEGRTVISFPLREYWLDIGQHADYQQAQKDVATWQS